MIINGYKVSIAPLSQNIALDPFVKVSEEFRKEFNNWLYNRFGYKESVPDGEAIVCEKTKQMYVNQYMYQLINRAYERNQKYLRGA